MAALASQDDVAQDDLRAIVEEFITTERNYVAHLSGLLSVFMPLYMESGACASVSESLHRMLQDLFASWKQLHDFHRSLLLTIETRCLVGGSEVSASHVTASGSFSAVASPVKNPQTKPQMRGRGQDMSLRLKKSAANGLANVVKSLAPYFKLYSAYCRLYPQIVPLFADARNDNAEFNDVVRSYEQDPVTCGLNIESILVKPVQRVCKYELFLRDMGKKAAKTTDSNLQMDIVMALQITKQAVGHVNQKDKDTENLAKVGTAVAPVVVRRRRPWFVVYIIDSLLTDHLFLFFRAYPPLPPHFLHAYTHAHTHTHTHTQFLTLRSTDAAVPNHHLRRGRSPRCTTS
jgi:hypothetical protein